MEEPNNEDAQKDKEWWDAIQRGELPPDLTGISTYLQRETLAFLLTALAFAFVEVHAEIKQRYAPVVPPIPYSNDLMHWLRRHLFEASNTDFQKIESPEQREALGKIAAFHYDQIGQLLAKRLGFADSS